jgi:hypothetical protein
MVEASIHFAELVHNSIGFAAALQVEKDASKAVKLYYVLHVIQR